MTDFSVLDNPIWYALTSAHRSLGTSTERAARYPADVSPLAGLREPRGFAFAQLRTLTDGTEGFALFTTIPVEPPNDWEIIMSRQIDQMVCIDLVPVPEIRYLELGAADVPEMLALTAATQPGPFLPNTFRMGKFLGIRNEEGRLVAMAGQRLALNGFTEISAVCTDPQFQGRGYARALVAAQVSAITAERKVPILHVKTENGAKIVYGKVGFTVRCAIQFTLVKPR